MKLNILKITARNAQTLSFRILPQVEQMIKVNYKGEFTNAKVAYVDYVKAQMTVEYENRKAADAIKAMYESGKYGKVSET